MAALRVLDDAPEMWGQRDGAALHVHGLVVDQALKGQGIGACLLRWVEQRARGSGRQRVRSDCASSNEQLRRYYVQRGFAAVGSKAFSNGWSPVTLLERRVSVTQLAGPRSSAPAVVVNGGDRALIAERPRACSQQRGDGAGDVEQARTRSDRVMSAAGAE